MLEFAHFLLIFHDLVDYVVSAVSAVLVPPIVAAILPSIFLLTLLAIVFVLAGLAFIRLLAVLAIIVCAYCGTVLASRK